jgi:carotenoid 1,2-hydratase
LPSCGFDFAQHVPANGYVWWYVDALSDDGTHGITVIAFVGSVFSPYYAFARRKGPVDPLDYCSINVSIYRKGGNRWAMTERPRGAVARSTDSLSIGPSNLRWDGGCLTITIDEITMPIPRRIRGTVRVRPGAITQQAFVLNAQGDHHWWPIAPSCRVEVALQRPDLQWNGRGYFDTNRGSAPLETDFSEWQWACGPTRNGAVILYEAVCRNGGVTNLALDIDQQGRVQSFDPPPLRTLKPTGWRIGRSVRSDHDGSIVRTLQDSPFYARSVVSASLRGQPSIMMHESLSLNRFKKPIVQAMLPFRIPKARR